MRTKAVRNLLTKNHTVIFADEAYPSSPVVFKPLVRAPYRFWKCDSSSSLTYLKTSLPRTIGPQNKTRVKKEVNTKSKMSLGVSKRGFYQLSITPRQMSK